MRVLLYLLCIGLYICIPVGLLMYGLDHGINVDWWFVWVITAVGHVRLARYVHDLPGATTNIVLGTMALGLLVFVPWYIWRIRGERLDPPGQ